MSKRKTATSLAKAISRDGSRATALPAGYATFLADLKARVRSAQLRAAVSVNRELIILYWDIGKAIVERQKKHKWGDQVINRLSFDLAKEFPLMAGFSRPNLYRMRAFFLGYSQTEAIVAQPVRQLPAAILRPLGGELNPE
jgi:predicted nuclease of restriction endonuclease-like (RecB) superfamily